MLPCGVVWFQMSYVVNLKHNTTDSLTLKLMPPVDVPWKVFSLLNPLFFLPLIILLFSLFMPSCISFILSSHSLLSLPFFPPVWRLLCLCQAFYGGSAGRTTKPQDAHTQPWYTLYSINSAHTQEKLAHTQSPADTLASAQTARAPLLSVSVWQISTILNISNSFLLVSATLLADPPPLRKHKEKMISFQLEQAQGNFPAVFTHSVRPVSLVHMWGAEKLSSGSVFVMDVHEPSCFFSSPPWSCYDVLLLKIVTLQERGENVFSGWGCSSGCNCSQRHDELVYKKT